MSEIHQIITFHIFNDSYESERLVKASEMVVQQIEQMQIKQGNYVEQENVQNSQLLADAKLLASLESDQLSLTNAIQLLLFIFIKSGENLNLTAHHTKLAYAASRLLSSPDAQQQAHRLEIASLVEIINRFIINSGEQKIYQYKTWENLQQQIQLQYEQAQQLDQQLLQGDTDPDEEKIEKSIDDFKQKYQMAKTQQISSIFETLGPQNYDWMLSMIKREWLLPVDILEMVRDQFQDMKQDDVVYLLITLLRLDAPIQNIDILSSLLENLNPSEVLGQPKLIKHLSHIESMNANFNSQLLDLKVKLIEQVKAKVLKEINELAMNNTKSLSESIQNKYDTETCKISQNIQEGLENQEKRIRYDLVTLPEEIVSMVKSGNVVDDQLQIQFLGSLMHQSHYSDGGDELKFKPDEELYLDVAIWHPNHPVAEQLRAKIFKLLSQKYKDIRLCTQNEKENKACMWLKQHKVPVINCLDFNYQQHYKIRIIIVPQKHLFQELIDTENQFYSKLDASPSLKPLYAYITNWFKLKLYSKSRDFDPFGAYEIQQVFSQYLDQKTTGDAGFHFREFMKYFAFEKIEVTNGFIDIWKGDDVQGDKNKAIRDYDDITELYQAILETFEYEYQDI